MLKKVYVDEETWTAVKVIRDLLGAKSAGEALRLVVEEWARSRGLGGVVGLAGSAPRPPPPALRASRLAERLGGWRLARLVLPELPPTPLQLDGESARRAAEELERLAQPLAPEGVAEAAGLLARAAERLGVDAARLAEALRLPAEEGELRLFHLELLRAVAEGRVELGGLLGAQPY